MCKLFLELSRGCHIARHPRCVNPSCAGSSAGSNPQRESKPMAALNVSALNQSIEWFYLTRAVSQLCLCWVGCLWDGCAVWDASGRAN